MEPVKKYQQQEKRHHPQTQIICRSLKRFPTGIRKKKKKVWKVLPPQKKAKQLTSLKQIQKIIGWTEMERQWNERKRR